ncbi:unnamed protein product [Chondrus crispus]|uniref:Uncharacterized protein n=1 Tax=Chondrus crispus TaxID=2769 RepID=R7QHJ9_CHOCR|nr:unnamed protein product [Chondrus crispus]CDF37534.1 unnamed protein product [Chondrus crispus]|eukprot:XP_005717405.1 unnamed protein product [Chondrus crispus]
MFGSLSEVPSPIELRRMRSGR